MSLNIGYLTCGRDAESDEVMTPYYAVEPLVKYLECFAIMKYGTCHDLTIWCPCDEEWSAYVNTFTEHGWKVIRSCIQEGQNFFEYEPTEHYDIIITNPPFSKKDKVLERLYELDKPFAILLPMNSLQGQTRFKYFKNGIQLLSFDKRIGFHTNGNLQTTAEGNHFASAYFCRSFLPKDLIMEELRKFDKPLIKN